MKTQTIAVAAACAVAAYWPDRVPGSGLLADVLGAPLMAYPGGGTRPATADEQAMVVAAATKHFRYQGYAAIGIASAIGITLASFLKK